MDFSVSQGGLVALLGQNGAGKSTTINIICTLLKKDAGCVRVCGADVDLQPDEVRASIGVVFQRLDYGQNVVRVGQSAAQSRFLRLKRNAGARAAKNLDGMLDLKRNIFEAIRQAFRRAAAADGHCPRADSHAKAADTRRADDGLGPAVTTFGVGDNRKSEKGNGHDGAAYHSLHGGGRPRRRNNNNGQRQNSGAGFRPSP